MILPVIALSNLLSSDAMKDYTATYITINNIQVAEKIAGEGETVLLLHGWGANIGLVWPLAESLLKKGYRCYALDMPGFGKSDDPPQAWTVFDYTNFIISYLNHHNLQQVYFFGHSFGGRLGLILGAEHSERIKKMALSDAAGIRQEAAFWPKLRLNTYKAIRDSMYKIGLKSLADNLRGKYNKRYASSDFQQVSGVMQQTFVNVVNQDLLSYAAQVKPGTLLFWGDKDEDTPLWMGQKLESTIPDAGLVIHEGAGHYAYLEKLTETVRVMDYFFKQE
jgi:pimeloyl-ACP methyl ester carboxylesterase